jgi:hypothetical protein
MFSFFRGISRETLGSPNFRPKKHRPSTTLESKSAVKGDKSEVKRTLALHKSNASRARTRLGRWHAAFLRALGRTPSVTTACKVAGINRRTAYDHRERNPEFAARWDDALNQSLDVLEHEIYQRALKEDAQLAMFILRAHRPSIYRETQRHEVGLLGGIVLLPAKEGGPE